MIKLNKKGHGTEGEAHWMGGFLALYKGGYRPWCSTVFSQGIQAIDSGSIVGGYLASWILQYVFPLERLLSPFERISQEQMISCL